MENNKTWTFKGRNQLKMYKTACTSDIYAGYVTVYYNVKSLNNSFRFKQKK